MAIKFTADASTADHVTGGGVDATNWSETFTDYHQTPMPGAYYHASGGGANYGPSLHMPYHYTITIQPRTDPGSGSYDSDGGNRYYPVSFGSGSVRRPSAMPNLVIYRSYSQSGPHQFESTNSVDIGWTGSSTHQGGLYVSFHVGDSAWSDMYEAQLVRMRRTYHPTLAGHGMKLTYNKDRGSGPFYVLLRGGFTFHVNASYPAMPRQVTAGGSVFSYLGNNAYQTWPSSTTSVGSHSGILGFTNNTATSKSYDDNTVEMG